MHYAGDGVLTSTFVSFKLCITLHFVLSGVQWEAFGHRWLSARDIQGFLNPLSHQTLHRRINQINQILSCGYRPFSCRHKGALGARTLDSNPGEISRGHRRFCNAAQILALHHCWKERKFFSHLACAVPLVTALSKTIPRLRGVLTMVGRNAPVTEASKFLILA